MRLSNRGFMDEFHKLYYNKGDEDRGKSQNNKRSTRKSTQINDSMRMSRTGHGGQHIDFDL